MRRQNASRQSQLTHYVMLHEIYDFDPTESEYLYSAETDEMQVAIDSYYNGEITAEQLDELLEEISLRNAMMDQFWSIFTHNFTK